MGIGQAGLSNAAKEGASVAYGKPLSKERLDRATGTERLVRLLMCGQMWITEPVNDSETLPFII